MYICAYKELCIVSYVYMYIYVYMYEQMYIHIYIYTYMYIYVYMYIQRERNVFGLGSEIQQCLKRCHMIDTSIAIPSSMDEVGSPPACSAVSWGCSLLY